MQVRPREQSLVLVTVGDPPDSGLSGLVVANVSMSSSFTHMLIITPDFDQRSGVLAASVKPVSLGLHALCSGL